MPNESMINETNELTPLVSPSEEEHLKEKLANAERIRKELITLLEKFENNTNSAVAWLVPVNTSTSIFPEFVSPEHRLSASTVSAVAASIANSLGSVWQNCSKKEGSAKGCSFKSLVDFIKSPIGAPVFSYSMLLCFKTLGDFAPTLPDNAAMLSVIGVLFSVSFTNGVLTHLGVKSDVNPEAKITRKDLANGVIAFISAAGFIAQIDRMLKINMDPETYRSFGPYMLPVEAAIGLVYAALRIIIPALIKPATDKENALAMMNNIKQNWDAINKHVRFVGNLIYISGFAIEVNKLVDENKAIILISALLTAPVGATVVDKLAASCSKQPTTASLIASSGVNSPVFANKSEQSINSKEEVVDVEVVDVGENHVQP
ncbi:hypothetical protein [Legionella taurinensis]|uniref:hypothetical protein n=1 Tax=Legionella taurinensis TaxID=70611 RepID=UPI00299EAA51|nr:hypothetical protein [Legionella taurinensis]MDX1837290.1 hypothetical protein [Legionella taurinensis]